MRIYFTLGICMFLNTAFPQNNKVQEPEVVTRCTLRPVKEIPLNIVIKDLNDKAPASGATVSIFRPFKNDSLHFAANDSGIVVAKFPGTEDSYTVRISAVGYQDTSFILSRNGKHDVLLRRKLIEMRQVVLVQFVHIKCRHYIFCECSKIKQEKVVNDSALNENNSSDKYLKLFPNPAMKGEIINIEFNAITSDKVILRICSMDGKIVHSAFVQTNMGANRFQVHAGNRWSAGTYIFQLLYAKGGVAASGKVIIQ